MLALAPKQQLTSHPVCTDSVRRIVVRKAGSVVVGRMAMQNGTQYCLAVGSSTAAGAVAGYVVGLAIAVDRASHQVVRQIVTL